MLRHHKITCVILLCVISIFVFFNRSPKLAGEDNFVNVCDWYGILTPEILHRFEKETGIRVQYDIFDNNEVLEAKLLASNCGYDVVFPSAIPYVYRQIKIGVYQKLNKKLLPNLKDLNVFIVDKMQAVDNDMTYTIPFYWGTLGIAIDADKVQKILSNVNLDSLSVLFNPDNLVKLKQCGVSFLEEAVDVFPQVQLYLDGMPQAETIENLKRVKEHLYKLRPYIRRFTSARFMNDLIMEDLCIAQAWSGEAHQAKQEVKDLGRKIIYVIPREGAPLWIDCIAIPKGAPHPKNAHKFINFLLRPDIAAKITNHTRMPTIIDKSLPMVDPEIRNDQSIYPDSELLKKLYISIPSKSSNESLSLDRLRSKMWMAVRLNLS